MSVVVQSSRSSAARPPAGLVQDACLPDSVQTQRRRPLALQVYMRGLSGLSANRRFVWSRPTNRSRWLRAAQATRRCGPIPANVAYTAPAIIPASSQPSRKCAGSKLPAAAEGYDTLAIRSGNALASASWLGAITPRSMMRPVTSQTRKMRHGASHDRYCATANCFHTVCVKFCTRGRHRRWMEITSGVM